MLINKIRQTFAQRQARIEPESEFLQSAVLLPLVEIDGQPFLLFEVRAQTLTWQPGEVCFPGGRHEPDDRDYATTAVRETCEELGLEAHTIELFGPLDIIVSPVGVILHPFVGRINDISLLKPNADEVGETFTVPLSWLLTATPHIAHAHAGTKPAPDFPADMLPPTLCREWRKRLTYPIYFYRYHDYTIWGLTAKITNNFLTVYRNLRA